MPLCTSSFCSIIELIIFRAICHHCLENRRKNQWDRWKGKKWHLSNGINTKVASYHQFSRMVFQTTNRSSYRTNSQQSIRIDFFSHHFSHIVHGTNGFTIKSKQDPNFILSSSENRWMRKNGWFSLENSDWPYKSWSSLQNTGLLESFVDIFFLPFIKNYKDNMHRNERWRFVANHTST